MKHRRFRLVVLVCALGIFFSLVTRTLEAGSLSPWLDLASTNSATPPETSAAVAVSQVASPALPAIGVEAENWSTGNAVVQAARVAATGATWTRVNQLRWSIVQPLKTSPYDWTSYDPIMLALAQQPQLSPIIIIGDTPTWALADPALPSGPIASAHLGEFASFVQAAVLRYGKAPYNIHNWELFNEPDSTLATWVPVISDWGNHGSDYAAMLKAAYPAIKAADSSATVFSGSLALDWFTTDSPPGPFNRAFIDDVLNAGGGAYFDVLGFHYYPSFAHVWAAYGVDIFGKTNYLRGILTSHGLAAKQLATTEMGGFGDPAVPATLIAQANYVPQVYARGMSAGLVNMMWFSLVGGTSNSGLLNTDGSAKPAYCAYQVATAELGHLTFAQTLSAANVGLTGPPASAFEGYLFQYSGTGTYRAVIWLNSGSATLAIHAPFLDEVTITGKRTRVLADSSGQVSIALDTNPASGIPTTLYLELPTNPTLGHATALHLGLLANSPYTLYLPFVAQQALIC